MMFVPLTWRVIIQITTRNINVPSGQ